MTSYSTQWATPSRNSRVGTLPRPHHGFTRVADLAQAPRYLLINGSGDHLLVAYEQQLELRDASGRALQTHKFYPGFGAQIEEGRYYVDANPYSWAPLDDYPALGTGASDSGITWALHIGKNDAFAITQSWVVSGREYPVVYAIRTEFVRGQRYNGLAQYAVTMKGVGCGALGSDGRGVVAMQDGSFCVFGPEADAPNAAPIYHVKSKVAFQPYDLSVVEGGYALLSRSPGMTICHFLDMQGRELWKASVPFDVNQPPVDGGQGLVYLAGKGFAAVSRGQILWAAPSPVQNWATAFGDGAVALSVGKDLRVLRRDGVVAETFRTTEGEALATPPAIDGSGVVWVASALGLYAAR